MNLLFALAGVLPAVLVGVLMLYWAGQTAEEAGGAPPKFWTLGRVAAAMAVSQLILAVFLTLYYGISVTDLLRTLLMVSILWASAWADARVCLIPNRVLLVGALLSLLVLGVEILQQPGLVTYLVLRPVVAALALLLATLLCRAISPKGVGMGDVKLLAVMGFCLGSDLVWPALFFSFVVLFVVCVFLLATRRAKRSDSISFAPFLLVGTLLAACMTGI